MGSSPASNVNIPEHDALPHRVEHSNHPHYMERGIHSAKLTWGYSGMGVYL